MNEYVEFLSLCNVWMDSDNKIWLSRLADLHNGHLSFPIIDDTFPKIFGNRERLYYTNGPSNDRAIGIWWWSASPRDSDATKDYILSEFQYNLNPTRFIQIRDISTLEQLSERLIEGIEVPVYECNTLFAYEKLPGVYAGLLCDAKELIFEDKIYLKKDTWALPIYQFNQSEIITIRSSMRFVKSIPLPPTTESLPVGNVTEKIKKIIINRMSWPLYKDCIGRTKAEWRDCKLLLERVCDESLYETVADKMRCTLSEATKLVHDFADRADFLLTEGDIDSDILAKIAMSHDDLRTLCESSIEEHWKASHADRITAAQAEFKRIISDKKAAEANYQRVLIETTEAQKKLDQLVKEIEEYKTLGSNTVQAIRDKISSAQKDMAGFIAELSTFMPQQFGPSCEIKPPKEWTFTPGEVCHKIDNMEGCSSWKDTFELLCDNIQLAGVDSRWAVMLSSFVYSAYLNHMPLLLAGPNSEAIAHALSMAVLGKQIDILRCYGEQSVDSVSSFVESELAAVQNPFHPGWISCLTQPNNGFTLWLHPFTEDLHIEPRSLYHYAYPVFTECFVDRLPSIEDMDAGHGIEDYTEFKPDPKYRAKMGLLKKLGMSRLMSNRLEKVLADAKFIGAISDTSMEYLFGLLPMCVLSGKHEIITELLDSEKNITTEVKAELQRYIEA